MIFRLLANPWTLAFVWIAGPAAIIYLRRRAKQREEAAKAAAAKPGTGVHAVLGGSQKPKSDTGVTKTVPMPPTPGFRDAKWGDAPSPAMEFVVQSGLEKIYEKPGELLRVLNVPVETIHYVYRDEKLTAVRIDAPLHAGEPLLKALTETWGPSDKLDPKALKHQWSHLVRSPHPATGAVLERSAVSRRTTLFIFEKTR